MNENPTYKMTIHDKLVRDKIPDIIKSNGGSIPCYACLNDITNEEFLKYLHTKLNEELTEYKEARKKVSKSNDHMDEVLELVDIVEVIYAIADTFGYPKEVFDEIRQDKLNTRGGFTHRIVLGVTYDKVK